MPDFIYHITTPQQWAQAQEQGCYRPEGYALEGFIHCCEASQIQGVVSRYFQGRTNLLMLKLNPKQLTADVRYERLRADLDAFPHLYGPLNLDAVCDTEAFSAEQVESLSVLGELET